MGLSIGYRPTSIPEKAGWEMGHLFLSTVIQTPVIALAAGVFTPIGFTAGAVFGVTQAVVEYSLIRICDLVTDRYPIEVSLILKVLSSAFAVFAGATAGIAVAGLVGFSVTAATALLLTPGGIIGVGLSGGVEVFRVMRSDRYVDGSSILGVTARSLFVRFLLIN